MSVSVMFTCKTCQETARAAATTCVLNVRGGRQYVTTRCDECGGLTETPITVASAARLFAGGAVRHNLDAISDDEVAAFVGTLAALPDGVDIVGLMQRETTT